MIEELYPCRICGHLPIFGYHSPVKIDVPWEEQQYKIRCSIHCPNCYQLAIPEDSSLFLAKKAWQARNEKFNPFLEVK